MSENAFRPPASEEPTPSEEPTLSSEDLGSPIDDDMIVGPGGDEDEPTSDDRLWAGISYLSQALVPVLVPVILLISESNKDRPFQRYHATHSLALFAISVLYEIVAAIVYAILTAISAGCFGCILWPVFLVPIVVLVYYAYLSYSGEYFEVPYLTEFLRDQDWI